MRKFVLLLLLPFVFTACSTYDPYNSVPDVSVILPPAQQDNAAQPVVPAKDYTPLMAYLKMDRPNENLGYKEKTFNTCKVGGEYSSSEDCHQEYFVTIHIQLLCRNSDNTLSRTLSAEEMFPLKGRLVHWVLHNYSGDIQLDDNGYGQIRTTAKKSQKSERLKITVGNDFAYMRANEITSLVTPQDWCNSQYGSN